MRAIGLRCAVGLLEAAVGLATAGCSGGASHPHGWLSAGAATAIPAVTEDPTPGGCTDAQKAPFVTTDHEAAIGGKSVAYTATVGFLEIALDASLFANAFNPGGGAATQQPPTPASQPKACLFFTYYQVKGGSAARPLTFAFNGGPGSASLWLHLGAPSARSGSTWARTACTPRCLSG